MQVLESRLLACLTRGVASHQSLVSLRYAQKKPSFAEMGWGEWYMYRPTQVTKPEIKHAHQPIPPPPLLGPPIDFDAPAYKSPSNPNHYWVPGDLEAFDRNYKLWGFKVEKVNNIIPPYIAQWEEGYEESLLSAYVTAGMTPDLARVVMESARAGEIPDRSDPVIQRWRKFQDLERNFPGFKLNSTLQRDARMLGYKYSEVQYAMKRFQDLYTQGFIGDTMLRVSRFIVYKPDEVAANLRELPKMFGQVLEMPFPFHKLDRKSNFLVCKKDDIRATLLAYIDRLKMDTVKECLGSEMAILSVKREDVKLRFETLRELFPDMAELTELIKSDPGLFLLSPVALEARFAIPGAPPKPRKPLIAPNPHFLIQQPGPFLRNHKKKF